MTAATGGTTTTTTTAAMATTMSATSTIKRSFVLDHSDDGKSNAIKTSMAISKVSTVILRDDNNNQITVTSGVTQ